MPDADRREPPPDPPSRPALPRPPPPERAAILLAARVEQVRRIERDLAEAQEKLVGLQVELDLSRAALRRTEAAAEDRRRLLRFEQQLRLKLERELHDSAKPTRGGGADGLLRRGLRRLLGR